MSRHLHKRIIEPVQTQAKMHIGRLQKACLLCDCIHFRGPLSIPYRDMSSNKSYCTRSSSRYHKTSDATLPRAQIPQLFSRINCKWLHKKFYPGSKGYMQESPPSTKNLQTNSRPCVWHRVRCKTSFLRPRNPKMRGTNI